MRATKPLATLTAAAVLVTTLGTAAPQASAQTTDTTAKTPATCKPAETNTVDVIGQLFRTVQIPGSDLPNRAADALAQADKQGLQDALATGDTATAAQLIKNTAAGQGIGIPDAGNMLKLLQGFIAQAQNSPLLGSMGLTPQDLYNTMYAAVNGILPQILSQMTLSDIVGMLQKLGLEKFLPAEFQGIAGFFTNAIANIIKDLDQTLGISTITQQLLLSVTNQLMSHIGGLLGIQNPSEVPAVPEDCDPAAEQPGDKPSINDPDTNTDTTSPVVVDKVVDGTGDDLGTVNPEDIKTDAKSTEDTTNVKQASASKKLANTGASVAGLAALVIAGVAGAAFIARRKRA